MSFHTAGAPTTVAADGPGIAGVNWLLDLPRFSTAGRISKHPPAGFTRQRNGSCNQKAGLFDILQRCRVPEGRNVYRNELDMLLSSPFMGDRAHVPLLSELREQVLCVVL